ncbi:MAG: hypothetical protein [Enterobacter phage ENC31]|nr:MAG: hypothetical protein [Enterobacter phage ENC31]UIW12503.1 MAG: hypothetical protein [Enterobacter phage ENC2-2_a]
MATHSLKINREFFGPVKLGLKTAELRLNDRDYKVGDWLILNEYDNGYTGQQVARKVVHVADVGSIAPGYVLMSCI